jgi:hypothetical protein
MMMDLNGTNEKVRLYWDIRRAQNLQSRMSWAGIMRDEASTGLQDNGDGGGSDDDGNNADDGIDGVA